MLASGIIDVLTAARLRIRSLREQADEQAGFSCASRRLRAVSVPHGKAGDAMKNQRDKIELWKDAGLPGGLELLRASCFDHRYPAHFHDEFVIAAFARGAQRYRVSRHEDIAGAGMVMVIAPGIVHAGEAAQRDQGWDYCAFYPSLSLMMQIADDTLGGQGEVDFGRNLLRHDPLLAQQMLRASAVMAMSDDFLEKECAIYEVLGNLISRYAKRAGRTSAAPSVRADVQRAIEFLNEHYSQQVSVLDVAASVGLSEFHFMRTFRAKTGISVHRYLTQIRLSRGKALLAQGVSAAQAASSVGFFDQSHFIKYFRTHFGITPGSFASGCR